MITHDQILTIVKEKGPVLPAQISEVIDADTMLIGALLSDLSKWGSIMMTKQKWSGSPLYYVDSQIEGIQKLAEKMNEKDRQAFELLKKEKVLQDSKQTPLMRTCLRALHDFAKPLKVRTPTGDELYWKWYLLSNEEMLEIVQKRFVTLQKPPTQIPPVVQKESVTKEVSASTEEKVATPPITQDTVRSEQVPPKKGSVLVEEDSVFSRYESYFVQKSIEVIQVDVIRKNSEFDVIAWMPTPLGKQKVYLKIKEKKKSNDADISQAYVRGSILRLPTYYIHCGSLTKKAEELCETDFAHIVVKSISFSSDE
ncbi:MAG: hypothetical protein ACMXYA_01080 [Candidatus Woesearchaeota archaeon]